MIKTPLGVYRDCFIGDEAVSCLAALYPVAPRADLRGVCQALLDRCCIYSVTGMYIIIFPFPYSFVFLFYFLGQFDG
jgi:hypothetical protein